MLGGASMSALLGQPVDSVQSRAVLGQPAPAVGRLERVTCVYQRAGVRSDGLPSLQLNLAAYTSQAAADAQLTTNSNAERRGARTVEEFPLGTARAVLFGEPGQSILMVSSGRSSVTITLRQGVIADQLTKQVLVDMAQRVLPNLAPDPGSTARDTAPRHLGEPR